MTPDPDHPACSGRTMSSSGFLIPHRHAGCGCTSRLPVLFGFLIRSASRPCITPSARVRYFRPNAGCLEPRTTPAFAVSCTLLWQEEPCPEKRGNCLCELCMFRSAGRPPAFTLVFYCDALDALPPCSFPRILFPPPEKRRAARGGPKNVSTLTYPPPASACAHPFRYVPCNRVSFQNLICSAIHFRKGLLRTALFIALFCLLASLRTNGRLPRAPPAYLPQTELPRRICTRLSLVPAAAGSQLGTNGSWV